MKAFALVLACLLVTGCPFILPNPSPHHGPDVISPEVRKELLPGTTTRTDVLLLLGTTMHRYEEDRFLVYSWSEVHAVVGLFIGAGQPLAAPLGDEHVLALEFRRDGVLRQAKVFRSAGEFDSEDREVLYNWMKAQGPPE